MTKPSDLFGTADAAYARRLHSLQSRRWKRWLGVQLPYRWNIRRLRLGRTLDVGCGTGRNLAWLDEGSIGVDHNEAAVAIARGRGLRALSADQFLREGTAAPGTFDSLLLAHVVEHLSASDGLELLTNWLPFLRAGGTAVIITPQELGHRSDATHVRFYGWSEAAELCQSAGLRLHRQFSFPLPRSAGKLFKYNETVTVAKRSTHG